MSSNIQPTFYTRSHLIYEIPYNNCENSYIGLTTQEESLNCHRNNKNEVTTPNTYLRNHTQFQLENTTSR